MGVCVCGGGGLQPGLPKVSTWPGWLRGWVGRWVVTRWVGRWVVTSGWVTCRFAQGLKKVGCMDGLVDGL